MRNQPYHPQPNPQLDRQVNPRSSQTSDSSLKSKVTRITCVLASLIVGLGAFNGAALGSVENALVRGKPVLSSEEPLNPESLANPIRALDVTVSPRIEYRFVPPGNSVDYSWNLVNNSSVEQMLMVQARQVIEAPGWT
ncbi:MAG: hypothetical protein QXS54_08465, partial [Candidatus Methanomethylicaceae archaeon]